MRNERIARLQTLFGLKTLVFVKKYAWNQAIYRLFV